MLRIDKDHIIGNLGNGKGTRMIPRSLFRKKGNDMSEETKIVDYRAMGIGRQNWEVCARMLVHDLLDIAPTNPAVKRILDFYSIQYTADGGYTMALPRLKIIDLKKRPMPKGKKK